MASGNEGAMWCIIAPSSVITPDKNKNATNKHNLLTQKYYYFCSMTLQYGVHDKLNGGIVFPYMVTLPI